MKFFFHIYSGMVDLADESLVILKTTVHIRCFKRTCFKLYSSPIFYDPIGFGPFLSLKEKLVSQKKTFWGVSELF
jgi:hypothetical protein